MVDYYNLKFYKQIILEIFMPIDNIKSTTTAKDKKTKIILCTNNKNLISSSEISNTMSNANSESTLSGSSFGSTRDSSKADISTTSRSNIKSSLENKTKSKMLASNFDYLIKNFDFEKNLKECKNTFDFDYILKFIFLIITIVSNLENINSSINNWILNLITSIDCTYNEVILKYFQFKMPIAKGTRCILYIAKLDNKQFALKFIPKYLIDKSNAIKRFSGIKTEVEYSSWLVHSNIASSIQIITKFRLGIGIVETLHPFNTLFNNFEDLKNGFFQISNNYYYFSIIDLVKTITRSKQINNNKNSDTQYDKTLYINNLKTIDTLKRNESKVIEKLAVKSIEQEKYDDISYNHTLSDKFFSSQFLMFYILDPLMKILKYFRELGLSHYDIKPGNIMISNSYSLILIDHELMEYMPKNEKYIRHIGRGTLSYLGKHLNPETDRVYRNSFNCIDSTCIGNSLIKLIFGNLPHKNPECVLYYKDAISQLKVLNSSLVLQNNQDIKSKVLAKFKINKFQLNSFLTKYDESLRRIILDLTDVRSRKPFSLSELEKIFLKLTTNYKQIVDKCYNLYSIAIILINEKRDDKSHYRYKKKVFIELQKLDALWPSIKKQLNRTVNFRNAIKKKERCKIYL